MQDACNDGVVGACSLKLMHILQTFWQLHNHEVHEVLMSAQKIIIDWHHNSCTMGA